VFFLRRELWQQAIVKDPERANVYTLGSRDRCPAIELHIWCAAYIGRRREPRVAGQIQDGQAGITTFTRWRQVNSVLAKIAITITLRCFLVRKLNLMLAERLAHLRKSHPERIIWVLTLRSI
jgi:hypothetical protein